MKKPRTHGKGTIELHIVERNVGHAPPPNTGDWRAYLAIKATVKMLYIHGKRSPLVRAWYERARLEMSGFRLHVKSLHTERRYQVTIRDGSGRVGTAESYDSPEDALRFAKTRLGNARKVARAVDKVDIRGNLKPEFRQPGWLLERLVQRRIEGLLSHDSKRPESPQKHYGIEIECYVRKPGGREMVAKEMARAGVRGDEVSIVGDGSLNGNEERGTGMEVRVLATEDTLVPVITKVCAVLRECRAHVDTTCGLHVHLDCRNGVRNGPEVYKRLVLALPFLTAMVPASRRDNRYCMLNKANILEVRNQYERYMAINGHALNRHHTVEVRLHSGTIDARKITNWCRILAHIADSTTKISRRIRSLKVWMLAFGLPQDLVNYYIERATAFPGHKMILNVRRTDTPAELTDESAAEPRDAPASLSYQREQRLRRAQ